MTSAVRPKPTTMHLWYNVRYVLGIPMRHHGRLFTATLSYLRRSLRLALPLITLLVGGGGVWSYLNWKDAHLLKILDTEVTLGTLLYNTIDEGLSIRRQLQTVHTSLSLLCADTDHPDSANSLFLKTLSDLKESRYELLRKLDIKNMNLVTIESGLATLEHRRPRDMKIDPPDLSNGDMRCLALGAHGPLEAAPKR